jgi:hypothetical protein
MTHKSKLDWWLPSAIVLAFAAFVVTHSYWIAGPVLLILMLCAYPQTYETTPQGLIVHAALMRHRIPYQVITFVGPVTDRGGRAVLSAGRVKIQYGLAAELLIAPADRDAFLADMAVHTPHLMRLGSKLTPLYA